MATLTRPVRGAPTAIESLPPRALLPALLAFPALLVLCAVDAGLAADTLFAGALVVAALLIAAAKARADTPPARPLLVAALAVFGAFCAWNYFSMLWAAAPSDAWEGANRALFYGLVLTLVGLRAWPRPAAETAFAVVGFGIGGMAAAVLGATAVMRDPSPLFFGGRLSEPTGYVNATAALWLVGLWPALHFSLSRSSRWPVRGLGLAVACLLLEMTLLTQSRGALASLAVGALVYAVLARRPICVPLAIGTALGLAMVGAQATDPLPEMPAPDALALRLAELRPWAAAACLQAFVVGSLAPFAVRRAGPAIRRGRPSPHRRRVLAAAAIGLALAALPAARWLDDGLGQSRQTANAEAGPKGPRYLSLTSSRYDFYRVAVEEFRRHPVLGIGSDNFFAPYLRHRRTFEAPRHPHSLAFRTLAQLGLVGAALLAVAVGLLGLAGIRGLHRREPEADRALRACALAGFGAWLAHGMGDWLWEFPAVGSAACALLVIGLRLRPAGDLAATQRRSQTGVSVGAARPTWTRRTRAGAVLGCILLVGSFTSPGVAAGLTRAAARDFHRDPQNAASQLELAARINPLAHEPLLARAILARRAGDLRGARHWLDEALGRDSSDWVTHVESGLVYAQAGMEPQASRAFAAAIARNPTQPLLRQLAPRAVRGEVRAQYVEVRLASDLPRSETGTLGDVQFGPAPPTGWIGSKAPSMR